MRYQGFGQLQLLVLLGVLYSPPHLTTRIQWIRWIPVDFQWIQQDYIIVIKRLQIYPVDPVDFWWIVVNFWWITGGSGGLLVDYWWIWWISGGSGGHVVDFWWICGFVIDYS